MPEILGLGGICVDRLGRVPRIPDWDDIEYVTEYAMQPGGMVATAMAAVARLGESAEVIGGIGDDDAGKFIVQVFRETRIRTDRMRIFSGGTTAFTFAMVHQVSGKRALIHYRGVQGQPDLCIPELDLSGIKFLHLDGYWIDTALRTARRAKAHDITITLDPSSILFGNPKAEELFRLADYLMPSYVFAKKVTGEHDIWRAAEQLLRYGAKTVIITKGEEGCFVSTQRERWHVPAFQVEVVDTTGAGDTFHGAFVAGLRKGYDLKHAIRFASAVAAIQCTKLGGHAGLPTFETTEAFLNTNKMRLQKS